MPKPARRALHFREREATRKRRGSRRQNPFRDTGAKNRAARGGGSLARGQRVWLLTHGYPPLTSKGLSEERDAAPPLAHSSPKPALQSSKLRSLENFPGLRRFGQSRLTIPNALLHSHPVSLAALRLLFTLAPERRSASFQNRCSPSPECPLTSFWDNRSGGSGHEGAKRERRTRERDARLGDVSAGSSWNYLRKLGNVLFSGEGNSEWALTATLERSGKTSNVVL